MYVTAAPIRFRLSNNPIIFSSVSKTIKHETTATGIGYGFNPFIPGRQSGRLPNIDNAISGENILFDTFFDEGQVPGRGHVPGSIY
jgi:hypothetical protein